MNGGVEGEDDAEDDEAADQCQRGVDVGRERNRDTRGQQGEDEREPGGGEACRRARAAQELRREGLHDPVADHPDRHEGAHTPEAPTKHAAEEDGQPDDEPDVTRREEKHASGREQIDRAVAREHVTEARLRVGMAEFAVHGDEDQQQSRTDQYGQQPERGLEPDERQQRAADKEPEALERIFRARQDRDPAEERVGGAVRHDELDRALGAHLGEVLGDAADGLRGHHVRHDQPRVGRKREHQ